jgi:hypothetical protein
MVVSPRSSHPFGISVVWHDVVIVGELFVADCAYSFLLGDCPLQKFAHFGWWIGVLISPSDDGDLQSSELHAEPAWVSEEALGRSRRAIDGLDVIRRCEFSSHPRKLRWKIG